MKKAAIFIACAFFVLGAAQARAQAPGPYFAADRARIAGKGVNGHRGAGARHSVLASWYGGNRRDERLSRHSADGSIFRPRALTAAHRTFAFGTRLRVSYRGRSTIVTVTDRGPARATGRDLDLSRGAAEAIGMLGVGVARVSIERVK